MFLRLDMTSKSPAYRPKVRGKASAPSSEGPESGKTGSPKTLRPIGWAAVGEVFCSRQLERTQMAANNAPKTRIRVLIAQQSLYWRIGYAHLVVKFLQLYVVKSRKRNG